MVSQDGREIGKGSDSYGIQAGRSYEPFEKQSIKPAPEKAF